MTSINYIIWEGSCIGRPPAKQTVIFKYPEFEKVVLSFSIDLALAGSSKTYLDPSKPIMVNNKIVSIPDLPTETAKLRVIERSEIDVTPLIKSSALGVENQIEVNYIIGDWNFLRRKIGKLTMSLTVFIPEKKVERMIRYCFFCGAQNEIGVKQCSRCGRLQAIGGEVTTICTNLGCQATIPLRSDVKFCDKCGTLQTERGEIKTEMRRCNNCGSMIPSAAKFCNNCGTKQ